MAGACRGAGIGSATGGIAKIPAIRSVGRTIGVISCIGFIGEANALTGTGRVGGDYKIGIGFCFYLDVATCKLFSAAGIGSGYS